MIAIVATRPEEWERAHFLRALTAELRRRGIDYRLLLVREGPTDAGEIWALRMLATEYPSLVWFVIDATSPILGFLVYLRKRIYGYVAQDMLQQLMAGTEPSEHPLGQLGSPDAVFVDYPETQRRLLNLFPNLRNRVTVVGNPVDLGTLEEYRETLKQPGLVLITEPFCANTGHILKVELARRLLKEGYAVWQVLPGTRRDFLATPDQETVSLYHYAAELGVEFRFHETVDEYYAALARAEYLLGMGTRAYSDELCMVIEAAYLNTATLLPDTTPLRAELPEECVYRAYNLGQVEELLRRSPSHLVARIRERLQPLAELHSGSNLVDSVLGELARNGLNPTRTSERR